MSNLMEMETVSKVHPQNSRFCSLPKFILYLSVLFTFLILFHIQASPLTSFPSSKFFSSPFFDNWNKINTTIDPKVIKMLRDSIAFLPLKDLRFTKTAMNGHTWYMSSLNDTYEYNEAEYLYFPSNSSKGRIICIKGNDKSDGTQNTYALAFPEALPESAVFLKGLTYISETHYDYDNLWHGLNAMAPFVAWSIKNKCSKPARWVLSHWGEIRTKMGSWLDHLMRADFGGQVKVESFENGNVPYCFERAVAMRHDMGKMGSKRKLQVFDLLRCKAREACGLNPMGKGREVNEKGVPVILLNLLMRRGSRSFKNTSLVKDIFAKECERVEGCVLGVVQSEDLNFCDQVRVMTNTDIVVSPHGAQLTNMLFMDHGSSVMEFFPKGWLNHAGVGQYVHHWMADWSGMKHEGAWWDPVGDECPTPKDKPKCFEFHKNGQVGHNETYFAEWAKKVLNQASIHKREQATKAEISSSGCGC